MVEWSRNAKKQKIPEGFNNLNLTFASSVWLQTDVQSYEVLSSMIELYGDQVNQLAF